MKPHLILLFTLLITACTENIEPAPTVSSTSESLPPTLTAIAEESQRWAIYSSDPGHLWNRMFRQFFARTASDGTEYGRDSLDPLLWPETTYLLEGKSYQQSIQLLDEFLLSQGEDLISVPLKRAMFQRDMWSVFDWLAFRYDDYPIDHPTQRQELQERIAKVIQRVALSKQEIEALPENYIAAGSSGVFTSSFQTEQPLAAFLPADLYSPRSAWICVGRLNGPVALTHTDSFPFLGRSVFLVYMRVPKGNDETFYLIRAMNTESSPDLPDGTEVALVRRVLLIDKEGEIVLSPLVASIQLRHFKTSRAQFFYEFQIAKPLLFANIAGGFQPVDKEIMLFQSHGDGFQSGHLEEARTPNLCRGCHIDDGQGINGINSILSYSRKRFSLPNDQRPILVETTPELEAKTVIAWKLMDRTWEALSILWQQVNP